MKVPDALQLRVGTVEIWRSLKTYSPIKARHLAAKFSVRLTEAFVMMENEKLSMQQCRTMVAAAFSARSCSDAAMAGRLGAAGIDAPCPCVPRFKQGDKP